MKHLLLLFLAGCATQGTSELMEVRQLKQQLLKLQRQIDEDRQRCQRLDDRVFMLEDKIRLERLETPDLPVIIKNPGP